MSPKDRWQPPPDVTYSKESVNRAGELLRDFFAFELESDQNLWDVFDGEEVVNAFYAVTWWKQQHARPLSKVAANLRYHVAKEKGEIDGSIDVTQRLKKRDTIFDKLERFPVSRRLRKTWTIVATRDYLSEPKPSGYRAIHHDVRRDGRVIEVQLRTIRQDAWANQVEDDGRALGTGYKFGFGREDIHAYYRIMSKVFWLMDTGQPLTPELEAEVRARYAKIRDVLRPGPRRAR